MPSPPLGSRPSGANRKHSLGVRHDPNDHAVDPPFIPEGQAKPDVVFSYLTRQRVRQTSLEAHSMVVDRLRHATRQGSAATPSGLAGEVVTLHRTITASRTAHGPAYDAVMKRVRRCYLEIAVSALLLAERATRPDELKRGMKSSTERYAQPRFQVPKT